MKRILGILAILLFLLGGIVLLNEIGAVRLLEMQVQLQRDRFLNFELSSSLLIVRMKDLAGQRRSMRDELSANVLETRVVNQIEKEFRSLTLLETGTLYGINAVRFVSLKPPLNIESGPGSIKSLQVAFYFERTRHYESALRVYSKALDSMAPSSDSEAFGMLHLGFCYVVVGDIEEALRLLEKVRSQHSGTHFGETADTLIRMILQGDMEARQIEKSGDSNLVKARKLASIGRCKSALEYYRPVQPGDEEEEDTFVRAGCLERMGRKKEALVAYRDLIRNGSPGLRREASRRLAISAEFHGGGSAARRFAIETMEADGDSEGLRIMEDAAAERKADLSGLKSESDVPEDVKKELASVRKETESLQEDGLFPVPEHRMRAFPNLPDNFDISIEAFGRGTLRLHSAVLDAADLEGESGALRVRILLPEIRRVSPGAERQRLRIFLRNGSSFVSEQLVASEDGFYDATFRRSIPFGQIVRIMGERQ